jgi:hypothetical protein
LIVEFSEALREMGSCLLEKITLNNDDESFKLCYVLFIVFSILFSYCFCLFSPCPYPSPQLTRQ